MLEQRVILIGGGGHAGVVLDVCHAAGVDVVGVIDDDPDCALALAGVAWLGPTGTPIPADAECVVAVGDLDARKRIVGSIDAEHAADAVVHPSAVVSPHARLGRGVAVMPGAVINRNTTIGDHAIINTGAIVEHDCTIGTNTHIAPGAVLGGGVSIGHGTLIGLRAGVLPGVRIGSGSVIGAGAVVTADIGDHERAVGVPARVLGATSSVTPR